MTHKEDISTLRSPVSLPFSDPDAFFSPVEEDTRTLPTWANPVFAFDSSRRNRFLRKTRGAKAFGGKQPASQSLLKDACVSV